MFNIFPEHSFAKFKENFFQKIIRISMLFSVEIQSIFKVTVINLISKPYIFINLFHFKNKQASLTHESENGKERIWGA